MKSATGAQMEDQVVDSTPPQISFRVLQLFDYVVFVHLCFSKLPPKQYPRPRKRCNILRLPVPTSLVIRITLCPHSRAQPFLNPLVIFFASLFFNLERLRPSLYNMFNQLDGVINLRNHDQHKLTGLYFPIPEPPQ